MSGRKHRTTKANNNPPPGRKSSNSSCGKNLCASSNLTTHDLKGTIHSQYASRHRDTASDELNDVVETTTLDCDISSITNFSTISSPMYPTATAKNYKRTSPDHKQVRAITKSQAVSKKQQGTKLTTKKRVLGSRRTTYDVRRKSPKNKRKRLTLLGSPSPVIVVPTKPVLTANALKNFPWMWGQELENKNTINNSTEMRMYLNQPPHKKPRISTTFQSQAKVENKEAILPASTKEELGDGFSWKMERYLKDIQKEKKNTMEVGSVGVSSIEEEMSISGAASSISARSNSSILEENMNGHEEKQLVFPKETQTEKLQEQPRARVSNDVFDFTKQISFPLVKVPSRASMLKGELFKEFNTSADGQKIIEMFTVSLKKPLCPPAPSRPLNLENENIISPFILPPAHRRHTQFPNEKRECNDIFKSGSLNSTQTMLPPMAPSTSSMVPLTVIGKNASCKLTESGPPKNHSSLPLHNGGSGNGDENYNLLSCIANVVDKERSTALSFVEQEQTMERNNVIPFEATMKEGAPFDIFAPTPVDVRKARDSMFSTVFPGTEFLRQNTHRAEVLMYGSVSPVRTVPTKDEGDIGDKPTFHSPLFLALMNPPEAPEEFIKGEKHEDISSYSTYFNARKLKNKKVFSSRPSSQDFTKDTDTVQVVKDDDDNCQIKDPQIQYVMTDSDNYYKEQNKEFRSQYFRDDNEDEEDVENDNFIEQTLRFKTNELENHIILNEAPLSQINIKNTENAIVHPIRLDETNVKSTSASNDEDNEWETWPIFVVTDKSGVEWLQTQDVTGKTFFINLSTGETSSNLDGPTKNTFQGVRNFIPYWIRKFLPTVVRSGCTDNANGNLCKEGNLNTETRHLGDFVKNSIIQSLSNNLSPHTKWRKRAQNDNYLGENFYGASFANGCLKSSHKMLSLSMRFQKSDLSRVDVICQWDRKFILGKLQLDTGKQILVCFDQHAVHERIRLEHLIRETYFFDETYGRKQIKSQLISPGLSMTFSETDVRTMLKYQKTFEDIGIKFQLTSETTINVFSVPLCFIEKVNLETSSKQELLERIVRELLSEEICRIMETQSGIVPSIPRYIHNLLCSQACHSAIKFGDFMELSVCKMLLSSLKRCQAPFQCAHGRPALVPLVEVSSLKDKYHKRKIESSSLVQKANENFPNEMYGEVSEFQEYSEYFSSSSE